MKYPPKYTPQDNKNINVIRNIRNNTNANADATNTRMYFCFHTLTYKAIRDTFSLSNQFFVCHKNRHLPTSFTLVAVAL